MTAPEIKGGAFRDQAISFRKRLYDRARQEKQQFPTAQRRKQFFLNIPSAEVATIQGEVWRKFFEEANLSRLVEIDYDSIISSRKVPDPGARDTLTFALSREYAAAISRTVSRLADWIVAAAISRDGRLRVTMRVRSAIWTYCMDFAADLSRWERFATWVDLVVRLRWQPTTADGSIDYDEIKRMVERNRAFYEKRADMNWHDWVGAAERGIELRLAISSTNSARTNRKSELAAVIRIVKQKNPDFTQREIAGRVDDVFSKMANHTVPIPKSWETHGVGTLVEAFDNLRTRSRVKKYISAVT